MTHANFTPHGVCLLWNPWLLSLTIAGDVAVALAYFTIPYELLAAIRRGRVAIPKEARLVLIQFALFIVFCGSGHLLYVWLLWHAWYWVSAIWTMGTAFFSWRCALYIRSRMDLYVQMLDEPVTKSELKAAAEALIVKMQILERRMQSAPAD